MIVNSLPTTSLSHQLGFQFPIKSLCLTPQCLCTYQSFCLEFSLLPSVTAQNIPPQTLGLSPRVLVSGSHPWWFFPSVLYMWHFWVCYNHSFMCLGPQQNWNLIESRYWALFTFMPGVHTMPATERFPICVHWNSLLQLCGSRNNQSFKN